MITLEQQLKMLAEEAPAYYSDIKLAVELAIGRERQDFLKWLSMHDTGIGGLLFTREEYLSFVEAATGQPASFKSIGGSTEKQV